MGKQLINTTIGVSVRTHKSHCFGCDSVAEQFLCLASTWVEIRKRCLNCIKYDNSTLLSEKETFTLRVFYDL